MKKMFSSPWGNLRETFRRRFRSARVPLSRLTGTANSSDEPLAILCGATKANHAYLSGVCFNEPLTETNLGCPRLRDIFKRGAADDCALTIVETKLEQFAWLNDGSWFFIPAWVGGEVSLPLPEKISRTETVKADWRRIAREGFEIEVTRDEERFKDFYYHLHLPLITQNFGASALIETYEQKRAQCKNFDLILLRRKSRPEHFVAGFLVVYEVDAPRIWSAGVRDGNPAEVRAGALAALYHLSLARLAQNGFTRVSLGKSRPFLRDGVLKFKRKLEQRLTPGYTRGLALKIQSLTPAVKKFLRNNPFIFQSGGKFNAAIFSDTVPTAEQMTRLASDYGQPGLEKMLVYHFASPANSTPVAVPPELATRMIVRRAEELVSGQLHLP